MLLSGTVKTRMTAPTSFFDGARGIAVLLVWLSHSSGRDQSLANFLNFHGIGHVGVMLFFSLSAFLLARNIRNVIGFNYAAYMVKRFFRIAPLYYIFLFSIYIYQAITGSAAGSYVYLNDGIQGLLEHLVFYKGEGVFWTLPVEFFYYLILPFICFFILVGGGKAAIVLLIFSVGYGTYGTMIQVGAIQGPYLRFLKINHVTQYIDIFVIGTLFGQMSIRQDICRLMASHSRNIDTVSFMLLLLTFVATLVFVSKNFLIFNRPLFSFRFLSIYFSFIFSFSLLVATLSDSWTRSFYRSRIFVFLGIIAFSWYLLHFVVLGIVNFLPYAESVKMALSTVILSLACTVSYSLIEAPFMRLGKALASRITQKTNGWVKRG